MTSAVSGAQFGAYTNLGKAKVDKWGSKENANDCYWNIAKNQLGEGATNQEIYKVMNELIELNAQKSSKTGEYNTTVYENQQVLLDLQSTINQSTKEIDSASELYESAYNNYSSLIKSLNSANSNYASCYSAYSKAAAQGDKDAIKSAYSDYTKALETMQKTKKELQEAQQELEKAQENIEELKSALNELKEEYEQKENVNSELKKEFDEQIKNFEEKIASKQKEVETAKTNAQKEIQKAQNNENSAVESNLVNKDENGNTSAKTDEELEANVKTAQIENLRSQYSEVQNEQGVLGKAWNGLKNVFHTKYSSNNVEKVFEKVESGEMTYEEAQTMISEYQTRQKSGVDTVANTLTGVATVASVMAAPVTGGASLLLGAAVAAGTKTGLKTLDRATNNVANDALDAKQMTKDAITGAVDGVVTVATMGAGNAVLQTSKETGKVLIGQTIKTGAAAAAKEGALDGGAANMASYMADVVTGDQDFSAKDLALTTAEGAAVGAATGAILGGITSGAKAAGAAKSMANAQAQAASEMAETAVYSAENSAKEGLEEAIADGQITNLQEALDAGYSQEFLKQSGMYDKLANNEMLDIISDEQAKAGQEALETISDNAGDNISKEVSKTTQDVAQDTAQDAAQSTAQKQAAQSVIDTTSDGVEDTMEKQAANAVDDAAQAQTTNAALKEIDNPDELCRQKGNGGRPLDKNYYNNSKDVREHFVDAMDSGEYTASAESYQEVMNEAHKLAYAGEDGNSLYYKKHGKLVLPDEMRPGTSRLGHGWKSGYPEQAFYAKRLANFYGDSYSLDGIERSINLEGIASEGLPKNVNITHKYPDPEYLNSYFEQMYKTAKNTLTLIDNNASEEEILTEIAKHYQYAVNARPYNNINNSLFMNEINTLLKKANMPTLPHGSLDFVAQRLQPENFIKYFIQIYKTTNLG